MSLVDKLKAIPHAEGVVWGLFGDDGASLIPRGDEERRISMSGGDLLLKRADVLALAASHDALMQQMAEALADALDSLEYVQMVKHDFSGYRVRLLRCEKARDALRAHKEQQ